MRRKMLALRERKLDQRLISEKVSGPPLLRFSESKILRISG